MVVTIYDAAGERVWKVPILSLDILEGLVSVLGPKADAASRGGRRTKHVGNTVDLRRCSMGV
jgi:hypothetical protein